MAESVWQYSHHLLAGLWTHRGPILTVANWSGTWPGLVGMLNLNGSLTKAGVAYSTLWSEDFTDAFFRNGLRHWLSEGIVTHDQSHVRDVRLLKLPPEEERAAKVSARAFQRRKAILGVFDEGCMGMFNAIIPDDLLHATGVFKERLSQSALYAAMREVSDAEARAALEWLLKKGMKFQWGANEETDLTEAQTLLQCKMYIAAVRIAADFGCATVGIQYQQGLKDLAPASDLVEGLLNNVERPPVRCAKSGRVLFEGEAIPHFNEVDECAGLDGLITNRLWRELGFAPENTLHDLRWGQHYKGEGIDDYVWVLLISGAVPPAHFAGGFKGRQQRAAAGDVFSAGRRDDQGHFQAGAHCVEPHFHHGREVALRPGRGGGGEVAGGGNGAALAGDDAAMADHAHGVSGHQPRPDDGAAQGEPYPGGLRAEQEAGASGVPPEGADAGGTGFGNALVRRGGVGVGPCD